MKKAIASPANETEITELMVEIALAHIGEGGSHASAAKLLKCSPYRLFGILTNPEYDQLYARARKQRAAYMADKVSAVIDGTLNQDIPPEIAKVAIGGLQWLAARQDSARYGEKPAVELIDQRTQTNNAIHVTFVKPDALPSTSGAIIDVPSIQFVGKEEQNK